MNLQQTPEELKGIENPTRSEAMRPDDHPITRSPDHPIFVEFAVFQALYGVFSLDSSRIAGLRLARNRLIIRFLWSVFMWIQEAKRCWPSVR
jgi:hypothetical protein